MNISRNFIKSISLATIMLLSFASFSAEKQSVTVKIEFNGARENIIQKVEFDKNISALEALLYVAKVQTHPIQGYVFVDIINDAPNVKGKKRGITKSTMNLPNNSQ